MPAVKLEIGFYDTFTPNTTFCQTLFTVEEEDYFLGVLLLDHPNAAKQCNPYQGCHCDKSVFIIKHNGITRRFCQHSGAYQLESTIMTRWLWVERWLDHYPAEYTILVFRFKEYCQRYPGSSDMSQCRHTSRCIENSLACEPPYKFCGDNTHVCHGHTGNDNGGSIGEHSNGSLIAGLVVSGIVLLLLGVVFYVCVGKDRICRIKRFFRRDTTRREMQSEARRIFTVQFTSRGVNSNSPEELGTINIAFSESPPDYDSVVSAEQSTADGDSGGDKDTGEPPPCYDIVMSRALEYKVKTLEEQSENSG